MCSQGLFKEGLTQTLAPETLDLSFLIYKTGMSTLALATSQGLNGLCVKEPVPPEGRAEAGRQFQ